MKLSIISLSFLLLCACSPTNKLLNKGEDELLNGNYSKAESYFKKAHKLDSNDFYTNYWLGTTLSEKMGRHAEAFKYLKKAEKLSPRDTTANLFNALGLTYQYFEDYDNALTNFKKMSRYKINSDDNKLLEQETSKNIDDCNYALSNKKSAPLNEVYVANLGSKINSSNPEYVPVILPNNDLIFTSKRQDSKEEKYNPRDGKFYESMYLSKYQNTGYEQPILYSIPDAYLKSKTNKENESVVSLSADGKTLFIYRNGKIYESEVGNHTNKPDKLSKNVNFNYYQSHAFLSKDGKTLFFTSEEGKNGFGGNDIYKSTKESNGNWSEPENLGKTINTIFDEDAPFLSDDGNTLYFSSKGHPGYGGYDIYKSDYIDNNWSVPTNLGKPLNSSGHDIFYTINHNDSSAYFSSNKKGGKGDMDIYKALFNTNLNKTCSDNASNLVAININDKPENTLSKIISFKPLDSVNTKIINFAWTIETADNIEQKQFTEFTFADKTPKQVNLKLIIGCDTCLEPRAICKNAIVTFKNEDVLVKNDFDKDAKTDLANNKNNGDNTGSIKNNPSVKIKLNPVYFDFNKTTIREDMIATLNETSEILKDNNAIHIDIYGHTDTRGNADYNQKLSYQRALSVKYYLIKKGVDKKQIKHIIAKGETDLATDCKDDSCDELIHQKNRRIEFLFAD